MVVAMAEILFKENSYKIMGALFEVYREMGCGFVEPVYQECMELELGDQKIPFIARSPLQLRYKRHILKQKYVPDAICHDQIVIELKAVKAICDEHRAQVHNYLKATGYRLGIIANFGHHPQLQWERIVR